MGVDRRAAIPISFFMALTKVNPLKSRLARWVGQRLSSTIPGFLKHGGAASAEKQVGAPPGIEYHPEVDVAPAAGTIRFSCCDWSGDRLEWQAFERVDDVIGAARPDWAQWRWINIDGLHPYVIHQLKLAYGFHTLAAEDIFNVPQRPKVEPYEDHIFVVARMLILEAEHLRLEQFSMVFIPGANLLLTFQENLKADIFEPVRRRMENPGSRFRNMGVAYLLYALLDSITDKCFPLLEHYAELLDDLEEECLRKPDTQTQNKIHLVKRELLQIRRALWPMRDMLRALYEEEIDAVPAEAKTFLRDVYDHAISVIDQLESHRETATSLQELIMTLVSNRMNEIMKVLTVMASVFIPITFIAGVYGMNFEYIPELDFKYGYFVFWGVVIAVALGLLGIFRYKKWL